MRYRGKSDIECGRHSDISSVLNFFTLLFGLYYILDDNVIIFSFLFNYCGILGYDIIIRAKVRAVGSSAMSIPISEMVQHHQEDHNQNIHHCKKKYQIFCMFYLKIPYVYLRGLLNPYPANVENMASS